MVNDLINAPNTSLSMLVVCDPFPPLVADTTLPASIFGCDLGDARLLVLPAHLGHHYC